MPYNQLTGLADAHSSREQETLWTPAKGVRFLNPATLAFGSTLTDQENLQFAIYVDGVEQDSLALPGASANGNWTLPNFEVDNLEDVTFGLSHDAGTTESANGYVCFAFRQVKGS